MQKEILEKLYGEEYLLNHIRQNPRWYKVLYYEPDKYKYFENEAKIKYGMTIENKIGKLKNQINFINGIYQYMKK